MCVCTASDSGDVNAVCVFVCESERHRGWEKVREKKTDSEGERVRGPGLDGAGLAHSPGDVGIKE